MKKQNFNIKLLEKYRKNREETMGVAIVIVAFIAFFCIFIFDLYLRAK